MLSSRTVVVLAYCLAACAAGMVVAWLFTVGVRESARYYVPALLIVLAAGLIHYRSRSR
ncbi:hypothetical protein [Streptomyces sp. NPDC000888]